MVKVNRSPRIAIVGAGPVGISAAVLLHQQGIDAAVFEARGGPCELPQAHVVNTRTSEILREMGAFDKLKAMASPLERGSSAIPWVECLAGRVFGSLQIIKDVDGLQRRVNCSPVHMLNMGQNLFERGLLEHLRSLGGDVSYGHTVTGAAVEDCRAVLSLNDGSGCRQEVFDYVLACDGARSSVRRAFGIEMEGPASVARYASAYFTADFSRYVEGRRSPVTFVGGPDVRGSFISFDLDKTWAFMCVMRPDKGPEDFTPDVMLELIRRAVGDPKVEIDLIGVGSWNMSAQVAARFREGPFFLVGDAAHRFPPTGGLGLNTGVQDAHNLAWKLAIVARGQADPALLDTYAAERRPIAQLNCQHSLSNAVKMVEVDEAIGVSVLQPVDPTVVTRAASSPGEYGLDGDAPSAVAKRAAIAEAMERQRPHFDSMRVELGYSYASNPSIDDHTYEPAIEVGTALPHAWVGEPGGQSTRDLPAGDRMTLMTGPAVDAKALAAVGNKVKIVQLAAPLAQQLGLAEDALVIVRPDRHVAWIGSSANGPALEPILATLGRTPVAA